MSALPTELQRAPSPTPTLELGELIDTLVADVDKPARYTGGEVNSVVKRGKLRGRLGLVFPDVYEVAESHIGLKILYDVVNRRDDFAAERVYALWPDLEAKARAAGVPLWTLESRLPLSAMDVVGVTLQYELSYPTILGMLEHGGVTALSAERGAAEPFVIGGGAGAYNPEPIAPFFDAFLLGDGEDAVLEIMECVAAGRERKASRAQILDDLARLPGIYVPAHFAVDYDGIAIREIRLEPGAPPYAGTSRHGTPRVLRRTIVDLDQAPYPTKQIVPNVQPVHERVAIEIQRGCSQSCRFCQAGMITRPTRQRKPETVLKLADEALKSTGADAVGLLSLSAGDYQAMNELLSEFFKRYKEDRIAVGLPSMRTETMTPELAEQVAQVRKAGWTFAPEAGSERMRNVINKTNREEDLLNAVHATVQAGWRHLKFYFQIGLPTETDDDVMAIAELGERALRTARQIRRDVEVVVSVSTFVPKPHTSFQWEAQIGLEETRRRHQMLRDRLRRSKIPFRYHDPGQSYLEGVLSRGDRRLAPALLEAARRGRRLDAWTEHYDHRLWLEILEKHLAPHGLTPDAYLAPRDEARLLPWDHLDAGILKKFLVRDRKRAYAAGTLGDCAFTEQCYACGGCHKGDPYLPRGTDGTRERLLEPIVHTQITDPAAVARPAAPLTPRTTTDVETRVRLRFRYAKTGRAVHLSQLDVTHQLLRAIRQAEWPVLYSQGMHPRPLVGFSPACPTGIESEAEYIEAECFGCPDQKQLLERLRAFLPDGIVFLDVEDVDWRRPVFNELLLATRYVVRPPAQLDEPALRQELLSFLEKPQLLVRVLRKQKPRLIDARAVVLEAAVSAGALYLTLGFGHEGSIKIGEAVAAILGPELARSCRIRKQRVVLGESQRPYFGERPHVLGRANSELELLHEPYTDLVAVSLRPSAAQKKSADPAGRVVPYAE